MNDDNVTYFVYWVTGSCLSGDRNAGLGEFPTLMLAQKEVVEILQNHPGASTVIIRGEEIQRT